jgi:hypothetical protein
MRRLPVEAAAVLVLYLVDALAIFVTYSRVPTHELYHVSHGGLAGGASRVVVFANFSTALVALAVLAASFERLAVGIERVTAAVAAALCAAVFWPGVVNQADLNVRPVNAIAAAGVGLTFALAVLAARRGLECTPWRRSDVGRALLAAPLVFVALPWIAAEVGCFLDGVPLLGRLFETGEHLPTVGALPPFPPAVHHGHHHGMDGLLLVLSALVLSRVLPRMRMERLREVVTAYLALMFCYGIANMANDAWLEQIVKRGWTTWEIPNVLEPRLTPAWAIIVASAAALWAAVMMRRRAGLGRNDRLP